MKKTKQNQKLVASAEEPDTSKGISIKQVTRILGLLVFCLFANTIGNGYNMDDELVTRNHRLTSRGLEAVGDIFTSSYYSDDSGYAYGYRPTVHLSFALEHQFFGEKPGVSHFFNVLLYALAVMLFFKLLLKWTGEKGLAVALIAALLFAVHSVHTEVVASLKNRDEILAFLFIILSALSLEKFLDKKKWISLCWVLLFFTLAMLSKKSVFPMAILLPVIAIFIKKINLKQLVFISIIFIVPAMLIGSEMIPSRMVSMTVLIIAAVAVAFGIHQLTGAKEITWKSILTDYRTISLLSAGILAFAFFMNNLLYVYLSLLLPVLAYTQNKRVAAIVFLSGTLVSAWFFENFELAHFGLLVSLYLVFENFLENRKDWFLWGLTVLLAGLLVSLNFEKQTLLEILACIVFLYLLHKKWILAVLYAVLIFGVALFLQKNFHVYSILLLLASALKILTIQFKRIDLIPFLLLGGMIITVSFDVRNDRFAFPQEQQTGTIAGEESTAAEMAQKEFQENKNVLKEGRSLEMIENTLVLPHTKSETVGTGAATLGEYLRLMVYPAELSFYYGYARTKTVSLSNPWVWISILVHLSLIILALWQLKKRPLLSMGIAWYLLSILLFSNWIELVAGMVGERLAFTASAGFCIFIASVIVWIKPSFSFRKPGAIEFIVGLAVIAFMAKTVVRNNDWKDPLTLMGSDIGHLQNSAQANNLYALHLMESSLKDPDQTIEEAQEKQRLALEHFDKALQIWPEFYNVAIDRGRAAVTANNPQIAIESFEKAIVISPTNLYEPYYSLFELYMATGNKKESLKAAEAVFELDKENVLAYDLLVRGYAINGQNEKAKSILFKGLEKFPNNVNLNYRLADFYVEEQQFADYLSQARKIYKLNLELKPEEQSYQSYNYLARGYGINGMADSARITLENGLRQFPGNIDLTNNLQMVTQGMK